MHVLFLTDDLMFASRVMGAARDYDLDVQLAGPRQIDALAPHDECRLVLVDLSVLGPNLVSIIATTKSLFPQVRMIGFGPHVDEALLDKARAAGCDEVWSRGEFQREHVKLLAAVAQAIQSGT